MMRKEQPGYMLVFSMIFIAMIVALSVIISNRSSLHVRYSKLMIDREKAKLLAYSGLQIAMAQLSIKDKEKKDGDASKPVQRPGTPSPGATGAGKLWTDSESKEFVKNIWPNMYKWQEFELTKDKYGSDGVIKICICSEEGKIDINQDFIFDQDKAKRKFVGQGQKDGDYKVFFENIFKKIDAKVQGANKFKNFVDYMQDKSKFDRILKNRQDRLYDVTEFLSLDGFKEFGDKIFYEPQEDIVEKGKTTKTVQTIYWTDIFTTYSGNKKINPWLISSSLKKLLGFKEPDLQGKAKSISDKYKENLSYPADWDSIFGPVFGMKYANLPAWFKFVIDTKFEPKFFSVLSCGKVDDVSHKIFAIIERKKLKVKESVVVKFEIIKTYCV